MGAFLRGGRLTMLIYQWVQEKDGESLAMRLRREPELKLALMVEPEAVEGVWRAFGLPPQRAQDCMGGGATGLKAMKDMIL